MAVILETIKQALAFLDGFDGYGMTATDEQLQVERLRGFTLEDDYHPPLTVEAGKPTMIFTEQNLVKLKTASMPYFAALAEGQHWVFTEKRILIVDDETGEAIKSFNKSAIQFAGDDETIILSPEFV